MDPFAEYQTYRTACALAAKPFLETDQQARVHLEVYANAEFWAGWNAAIAHAAKVAKNRHECWKESTVGSSAPDCDVSACEDIADAIRMNVHRKPCASRPLPAALSRTGTTDHG